MKLLGGYTVVEETSKGNINNEISARLSDSLLYQTLIEKCRQHEDDSVLSVQPLIIKAVGYAHHRTKLVIRYMKEYTLHDSDHLFRVLYLMERLIPTDSLEKLSIPELMLLILAAFFHDIGMAPSEREVRSWLKDFEGDEPTDWELEEYKKFHRYKSCFPEKLKKIENLRNQEKYSIASTLEDYLVTEYIRSTHAKRAREIISEEWAEIIKFNDVDLTSEFADLCFSHNENALELLQLETSVPCGQDTYVCLPFIGVILRLADILDFDAKRTPTVLFSHLAVRNPISLGEWQKHRSIQSWAISPSYIAFSARCNHPAIEASIREFCDQIDEELKNCSLVISNIKDFNRNRSLEHYQILFPPQIDRSKIEAKRDIRTGEPKYIYRDTQFKLSKNQVIDLLMGTKLYGNTEIALRELIQNSIDACMVSAAMYKTWGQPYDPKIIVSFYTENGEDCLEVYDNGIGMNQEIIDKYYSKIGSSYYKSQDFYDLRAKVNMNFAPISRFGIGVLSVFMVSDVLIVSTRRLIDRYEFDDPIDISVEGQDSIFYIKKGNRKEPGTTTKLILREKNPWSRLTRDDFIKSVKKIISNPPFDIEIRTDKERIYHSTNSFSSFSPHDLKDYIWDSHENVKEILIDITDESLGFTGSVIVGIIEQNNLPVANIEILSKEVELDEVNYDLSMEIYYGKNAIEKDSNSIGVNDKGEVESSNTSSYIVKSKSFFSIHGIQFFSDIFPHYSDKASKAILKWPLPMLVVLDIVGHRDLDLNSARTEIIYNEKWLKFEKDLAFIILKRLSEKLNFEYWRELQKIIEKSDNELFTSIIKNINK